MGSIDTARATAAGVGELSSRFMLDLRTYEIGGSIGFAGVDFYIVGRAGVLGDVPGSVAAAAMVFFEPATVTAAWERGRQVLPPQEAAVRFAEVGHEWARQHLPDGVAWGRLAELARAVVTSAPVAGAPLLAGWRELAVPDDDRAAALHHMNGLRELRMARHAVAVLAAGIAPHAAVALRSPGMLPIFGWAEPHPDPEQVRSSWDAAEAATDRLVAGDLAVLDQAEQAELVSLVTASMEPPG